MEIEMHNTLDLDASPVTEAFAEMLATIQTNVVDAIAGFETMLKRCEPEIEGIVRAYLETHEQHNGQLSERLQALGKTPDDDGSFFSTVQKAVVNARALFDFVGTNVLTQVVSGEEKILGHYREAYAEAGVPFDQDMLKAQIAQLERLNDRARAAEQSGSPA